MLLLVGCRSHCGSGQRVANSVLYCWDWRPHQVVRLQWLHERAVWYSGQWQGVLCVRLQGMWMASSTFLPNVTVKWELFSQFEMHFQLPLGVCMFILPAGSHAMLLQCANIFARTDQSNTKYNTKIYFLPWQFERLQIYKSKPRLNLTTINNYHWFSDPKFCMHWIGIFQIWQTKVDLSIPECTIYVVHVQQARSPHFFPDICFISWGFQSWSECILFSYIYTLMRNTMAHFSSKCI